MSRSIGPVAISCVLKEAHTHRLGITRVPIETGAAVTDHAYIEPKKLRLDFADANAAATFNALSRFQESRVPFAVVSGLYVYTNMLIEELAADRDAAFSKVLSGYADLHEVIIVETAYAQSEQGGSGSGAGEKTSGQSSTPSKAKSGDSATANRASGTVTRGDAAATTTSGSTPANRSILRSMF